jgi:hypothetical protein
MDGAAAAPGDISPQMLAMIEAMFGRILAGQQAAQQGGGGGGGAPNISALLAKELLDANQTKISTLQLSSTMCSDARACRNSSSITATAALFTPLPRWLDHTPYP